MCAASLKADYVLAFFTANRAKIFIDPFELIDQLRHVNLYLYHVLNLDDGLALEISLLISSRLSGGHVHGTVYLCVWSMWWTGSLCSTLQARHAFHSGEPFSITGSGPLREFFLPRS